MVVARPLVSDQRSPLGTVAFQCRSSVCKAARYLQEATPLFCFLVCLVHTLWTRPPGRELASTTLAWGLMSGRAMRKHGPLGRPS